MYYLMEVEVTDERLSDVVCAGMEGGIGYWASLEEIEPPKNHNRIAKTGVKYMDAVMNDGGELRFVDAEFEDYDAEPEVWVLTYDKLRDGLELLCKQYPKQFKRIIDENEDADTGDILIQLSLFGDVVYG